MVLVVSFAVLGGVGIKVLKSAPPIPSQVVTSDGQVLFDGETIQDGQGVWQSIGGQEVGTIWGHGAYVAPDWTADWLHRESVFILDRWAKQAGGSDYAALGVEQQAALQARLQGLLRHNTYDPPTGRITVDPVRVEAFDELFRYYSDVFSRGRNEYAIQRGALSDPAKLRQMSAFFWWTAWAASTNRPGTDVTYTQNWPHEPLDWQRADRRRDRVERHQFCLAAGRRGRHGLVFRIATAHRRRRTLARQRSAAGTEADVLRNVRR